MATVEDNASLTFHLGQPVRATDAAFGEIGDIVIDPATRAITHLVVEPHHEHVLARLVPIWLVDVHDDAVTVQLDIEHLRQLDRVAFTEFVDAGDHLDLGGHWDLGITDCISLPFVDRTLPAVDQALRREFNVNEQRRGIEVAYDRVPKGYCEIRRSSDVMTLDDHRVGHVDGFVTEAEKIVSVIVQAGIAHRRRHIIVPIGDVSDVRNDVIALTLRRSEFRRLPRTSRKGASA